MNLQYFEQHFPLGVSALSQLRRYQTPLSWVVFACLVAQVSWSAGQLVWMPFQSTTINTWHPSPVANLTAAKSVDVMAIKEKNLFGVSTLTEMPGQVVNQDAPQTRLNLTLVGVVVTGSAKKSLAIIANDDAQSTYGINEKIEGTRAKLKAVFHDRIIINNAGKDETLMLDDVDYSALPSSKPRISLPPNETSSPEQNSEGIYGKRPPDTENPQEILGIIRRELTRHPQTILDYIHFSKISKSEKTIGYRLSPGKVPQFFSALGLKDGDIATALNDIKLSNPKALGQIMKQLSDADGTTLTIERDGQTKNILIQF